MMKTIIALCLVFIAGASAQNACGTMKWATCDGTPVTCTLPLDTGYKQILDCTKLIPKCYLMKAEMFRAKNNLSTRTIGGKPVETAFVDNDGIYDPVCGNDGSFKAVQCNNTDTCWCVNSAGVRRSDKGDKNIKCEPVETYWVRIELKHKDAGAVDYDQLRAGLSSVLNSRYNLSSSLVKNVEYDNKARLIVVDIQKNKGERLTDLSRAAYYMEKDVKALPLFKNPTGFNVPAGNVNLAMENILVYYVDEVAPTFTMKRLTGGVIAVIVVVALAVLVGLAVLYFVRKRDRAQYTKAQAREMENMS